MSNAHITHNAHITQNAHKVHTHKAYSLLKYIFCDREQQNQLVDCENRQKMRISSQNDLEGIGTHDFTALKSLDFH